MKLYTRKGDAGYTALFGGRQVRKDDPRVQAYGTLDELNAVLGWASAACADQELTACIRIVQERLLRLGAELAMPIGSADMEGVPTVGAEQIAQLERWIDEACGTLPKIRTFILPGGSEPACRLHIARAVCRRAERLLVDLSVGGGIRGEVLAYLNRLSDLLFVWARRANHLCGIQDEAWSRETP